MPIYAPPEGTWTSPLEIQQPGIEAILLAPAQTATQGGGGGDVRPSEGQLWPR